MLKAEELLPNLDLAQQGHEGREAENYNSLSWRSLHCNKNSLLILARVYL